MLYIEGFVIAGVSLIAGYYLGQWRLRRCVRMQGEREIYKRTIKIEVDTSQAIEAFTKLEAKMKEVKSAFLLTQHKFQNNMRKTLTDQTSAAQDTNYVIDSKAKTVTGNSQKVLVDTTDKTESPDGDPVDLAFNADEQASILAATDTAVQGVLDARAAADQGSTGS